MLQIDGEDNEGEVPDLIDSIDAFAFACRAGFFAAGSPAGANCRIVLSCGQLGPARQWELADRAFGDGARRILLRLIRDYDTDRGCSLAVKTDLSSGPDATPRGRTPESGADLADQAAVPFGVEWNRVIPLGRQPVIRIEFDAAPTDPQVDEWFRALAAWERIAVHHGFDHGFGEKYTGPTVSGARKQGCFSEIFMLSPTTLECSLHGVEPNATAVAALFRFAGHQAREGPLVRHIELQP